MATNFVFNAYLCFIFLVVIGVFIAFWFFVFKILKRIVRYLDLKIAEKEKDKF